MNSIEVAKKMIDNFKEPYNIRESRAVAGALVIALPVVEAAMELQAESKRESFSAERSTKCWLNLEEALTPWQEKEEDE